jgi:hypothetical protein
MKCRRFTLEDLKNEEWAQFYASFGELVEQCDRLAQGAFGRVEKGRRAAVRRFGAVPVSCGG